MSDPSSQSENTRQDDLSISFELHDHINITFRCSWRTLRSTSILASEMSIFSMNITDIIQLWEKILGMGLWSL